MNAGDLTREDLGTEIVLPIGEVTVHGVLKNISRVLGMVNLELANGDTTTQFAIDPDKTVTITYDHARFRALTEEDPELRGKFLHEANHLAVLQRVNDIVEEP